MEVDLGLGNRRLYCLYSSLAVSKWLRKSLTIVGSLVQKHILKESANLEVRGWFWRFEEGFEWWERYRKRLKHIVFYLMV